MNSDDKLSQIDIKKKNNTKKKIALKSGILFVFRIPIVYELTNNKYYINNNRNKKI